MSPSVCDIATTKKGADDFSKHLPSQQRHQVLPSWGYVNAEKVRDGRQALVKQKMVPPASFMAASMTCSRPLYRRQYGSAQQHARAFIVKIYSVNFTTPLDEYFRRRSWRSIIIGDFAFEMRAIE